MKSSLFLSHQRGKYHSERNVFPYCHCNTYYVHVHVYTSLAGIYVCECVCKHMHVNTAHNTTWLQIPKTVQFFIKITDCFGCTSLSCTCITNILATSSSELFKTNFDEQYSEIVEKSKKMIGPPGITPGMTPTA